jgi:GntR family transcriptional repressor for pyruvate dehydrogenase complex
MISNVNSNFRLSARKGRSRSLARELADRLAESIRGCVLRPGEKLPTEAEIIQQFGVSRTVVREAISSLQASGLVETRHGIGTFVRSSPNGFEFGINPESILTVRDVLAMLELRISLETEAAGLAAARRSEAQLEEMRKALLAFEEEMEHSSDAAGPDFRFHLQVAYATGNRYFVEVMSHLGTATIPRARLSALKRKADPDYLKFVNQQHAAIFGAIVRKDPETARAAMRAHLNGSYERLRRAADAAESQEGRSESNLGEPGDLML